ncbi:alpha/beta fold hydrolase [Microlunatus ginsengisoli]
MVPGFISHIEFAWHEPLCARFLRSLSDFGRLIAFDKRGMGQSDRDPHDLAPTMQQRCNDVLAVLDAAASDKACLLAWSEGGPTAIRVATMAPERVSGLILIGTAARFASAVDYAHGLPPFVVTEFIATLQQLWGSGVALELYAPTLADSPATRKWWATYQRLAATPGAVAASLRMQLDVDVRDLLPEVTVPTLVIHETRDMVIPVEAGRYLAEQIPGARIAEIDGHDHMYWVNHQAAKLSAIRDLLDEATSPRNTRTRRRRPVHGWPSLTETELTVAELVATGMTNPEIAQRLVVSPRTVQSHVAHILQKLGKSRRTEIAAAVTERATEHR